MPFQASEAGQDAYLLDEDILIDSEVDGQAGDTNMDFTVTLPKALNNVVALEVSEVEINRGTVGVFSLEKWLDISILMDPMDGNDPVTYSFSVELPPLDGTSTEEEIAQLVALAINNALREEFTDGNWLSCTGGSYQNPSGKTIAEFVCQYDEGGPGIAENTAAARTLQFAAGWRALQFSFLFGSGPNADTSIAENLGFVPGVDLTVPRATVGFIFPFIIHFFTLSGTNEVVTTPYRYLDVSIDQVPEFTPFFRFYPPNPNFSRRQLLPGRSRVLTRPIKRLNQLTIRIRHRLGIVPLATFPVFIHLRVFHVVDGSYGVPDYLMSRIMIK